jgi:hypothetical protein
VGAFTVNEMVAALALLATELAETAAVQSAVAVASARGV